MGKAIVIKDADYSAENIGKVTFTPNPSSIAKSAALAYCAAIGNNEVYEAIFNLVLNLVNAGVWDKMIGIYPMLGTTTNALKVNLINPGTFDLAFSSNVSVINGGNGVNLQHDDNYQAGDYSFISKTPDNDFFGFSVVNGDRVTLSDQFGKTVHSNMAEGSIGMVYYRNTTSSTDTGLQTVFATGQKVLDTYVDSPYAMEKTKAYAAGYLAKNKLCKGTVDNTNFMEFTTSAEITTYKIWNNLGENVGASPVGSLSILMRAMGWLNPSEAQIAYTYLKNFAVNVKGISIE